MSKLSKGIRIALAVLLVAAVILLLPKLPAISVQDILTYTPESPLLAALALLCLYCMKSVIIGIPPLSVLFVSAGIMFQMGGAFVVTLLGLTCELSIGYLMGARLGREKARKLALRYKKLEKFIAPTERTFNAICFVVRLVPGPLPLDVMTMLFGATRISYGRHLLFSLLGVAPGMIAWIVAGRSISNPLSKEFLIPFSIAAGISLIALLIFQWVEKQKQGTDAGE